MNYKEGLRQWVESKGIDKCKLCGGNWDFEDIELVFLPGASTGMKVGSELGEKAHTSPGTVKAEFRKLFNQLSGFRSMAQYKPQFSLTCQNCANTILLDATKTGLNAP